MVGGLVEQYHRTVSSHVQYHLTVQYHRREGAEQRIENQGGSVGIVAGLAVIFTEATGQPRQMASSPEHQNAGPRPEGTQASSAAARSSSGSWIFLTLLALLGL